MKHFYWHWMLVFVLTLIFGGDAFAQVSLDTLRVGLYESPPFVMFKEDGSMHGVSAWLWEQIRQDLNRPFKLVPYSSGQPLKTLLYDLETSKIDLAINPITITSDRNRQINFTYPFYVGNLTIAERKGSRMDSIFSVLKAIFSIRLLYLVLILFGLVIMFGFLIWLVEKQNNHFERGKKGLVSSFWWSAVTMTTVGYGDKVPVSNLGRFIALIWMLCSLIIISIFTASITSSLTVHKLTQVTDSLENYRRAKVGTVESSATDGFLQRNFFRDVHTYPEFISGLKELENNNLEYFIYDEPWLDYQLNNNPEFNSLRLLPMRFNVQLYAMPMAKTLSEDLHDQISAALLQLTESHDWELLLDEYQLKEY
ncbi:transporter substrate-binding domain-containing protein [Mangrovimonas sp. TPBH4]|uniref:transporter substrate-binding domain-containing protein n=1 Tax=Mangrovimonas sp. TPBH4 TaxID=1645914 RepID=UPI0006B519F0|nr:transporter substrate-binding domain-containing protein [Mangrovimonas sp. TPBH4]